MKRLRNGLVLIVATLGFGLGYGHAQLFDNLRALAGSRYPVGDPQLTVTNLHGEPVVGPKDIAVADLDGDGKPDFAVANKDGTVTVYFGVGDGTFSDERHLRTRQELPLDLQRFWFINIYTNIYCDWQATNFSLACYTNYIIPPGPPPVTNVMCVTNLADNSFTCATNIVLPPPSPWITNVFCLTNYEYGCGNAITNVYTNRWSLEGPFGLRGLAIADFTGDGRKDIAVASPGESLIYLFINQGGRDFGAPTNLPAWFGVRDLAAGDFDGDGRIDLAAAGTTNGLAQFRALGGGAFLQVTNLLALASNVTGEEGDYDFPQPAYYLKAVRQPGDTRDELVVSFAQREKIWVLRAGADGRLAITGDIENVSLTALDVAPLLHPATNGAAPDLITAYSRGGCLDIFAATNTPQRFMGKSVQRYYIPGAPRNVRIADLDGDGWNDVVVVAQLNDRVLTYKNNQGQLELVAESIAGRFPREMDLGDFNADGRPDLAVLNRISLDVSILLTATNLLSPVGFLALDSLYPVDGGVNGLEVRDYNGDGRDDVVQLHLATAEISVRLANTNGLLSPPQFYPFGGRPSAQSVVDVNNDGIPDMVGVDLTGSVSVRLGLGDGTFGPEQRFFLPENLRGGLYAVVAADFDNDGKVDLAAGYFDCRLVFLRGNGDGTFAVVGDHDHPLYFTYEARSMVAADFDHDGDLDLAGAGLDGRLVIVENKGDLLTTSHLAITSYPSPNLFDIRSLQVLDANQDGDWDLFMAGTGGTALYLGGPGMSFTLDETSLPPHINGSSTAQADFDGDGIVDLAVADAYNKTVTILTRRDPSTPYEPVLTVKVPSATYLATGDLDGDGLPDLVGTGDVLWVALSSRHASNAPPAERLTARHVGTVVINEVFPQNTGVPLAADGNRTSDWIELYNGASQEVSIAGWRLLLVHTNIITLTATNGAAGTNQLSVTNVLVVVTNLFTLPADAPMAPDSHRLLICSERIRTIYHTGFTLPAEGGLLLLFDAQGTEMDRVKYPAVGENLAFARYSDGARTFVVNNIPSPGAPNVDNGAVDPVITFNGVDLDTLQAPGQALRFRATARDDMGVVNVSVLWRRLDVPDSLTKRVILFDDGMHDDAGMLDGAFAGMLTEELPASAEIQFYLECADLTDQLVTAPGNPRFVSAGEVPQMYTLALGVARPPLEISEIVANNVNGLTDERGGHPDWVEIRNCSSEPLSLVNVSLGLKFFGDNDRMTFTNRPTIGAGEHVVIYADGNPAQGQLHAPFKLDRLGGRLFLTGGTPDGARYLIDSLVYGPQGPDTSLARLGCGGPWAPSLPTPRAANVAGPWRALVQSNSFLLAYPTRSGRTYTVEYNDHLGANDWIALPAQPGLGLEQTVQTPFGAQRFIRVREE